MNGVEMEPPLGCLGHGNMAGVNWIEGPSEERHRAAVASGGRFVGGVRGQRFSL